MGKLAMAERAERASADEQREMLLAAYAAIHGMTLAARQYDTGVLGNNTSIAGRADADRFARLLAAEAYESAAVQLVPTGYGWRLWMPNSTCIALPRVTMWGNGRTYAPTDSEAATPALALCASSLRARDGGEGL